VSPVALPVLAHSLGHRSNVCALTPSVIETVTLGQKRTLAILLEQRRLLVSARGIEPPRPFGHQILNLARLPFRHADNRQHDSRRSSEVFDRDGLDVVGGREAEDPRVEIELALDGSPDIGRLPEAVLLALE